MKKLSFLFTICLFSLFAFTQQTTFLITGKVIDAANKTPLIAASVFAQNTTTGTATNNEGVFTLRLNNGGYDLVITFTGYETVSKRISTADAANSNIVIELKQKDKAMEEISIVASNEVKNGLEKYGDFFIENFIGKTANSKQCSIQNKEALKFYFSKKRNRLKVLASEPIIIKNPALGYTIKYSIDSFTYDYGTLASAYIGYPLFEAMQPVDSVQAMLWQANRQVAYKGSILHFMRSVYNKDLKEEGFEIQFLLKNAGTESAIQLKNFYAALNYKKDDSTMLVDINPNQPDVAVLYKNEKPVAEYFEQNDEQPKEFQLSLVNMTAAQSIGIEQNGYYFDQNDIIINGYWSWEKVGDMLPYDFNPAR